MALPFDSALCWSFLKLKEGLGAEGKSDVLTAIEENKNEFGQISQLCVGKNFSLMRANGFSIASVAIFLSLSDLEAIDSDMEALNSSKDKVVVSLFSCSLVR